MKDEEDTVDDFEDAPKTIADSKLNRLLANFRTEGKHGNWPCRYHPDAETTTCDNCEVPRCLGCMESCPCQALERRGIYLSFGPVIRCCFCGVMEMMDTQGMLHARSNWGDAYGHSGCIIIRANRLQNDLNEVLAKEDPLPDLFSLIFDQEMHPLVFEGIDRDRVDQWCAEQSKYGG